MNAKDSCHPLGVKSFILMMKCLIFLLCSIKAFSQCSPHNILTPGGSEPLYACAGDNKPDVFSFSTNDTSNLKYAYVFADGSDNILSVQKDGSRNFDGINPMIFRVWGISYSDSIVFAVGQDVTTIMPVKGCARLSENVIRVIRDIPSAEDATLSNGSRDTTICFNNMKVDTLFFTAPSRITSNQLFLVTTFNGLIVDFFKGTNFLVDFLPMNDYLVYNLYFTGGLTISPNSSNINNSILSNGCFSVGPRPVRVNMREITGGTIEALTQETTFCPQDDKEDLFFVRLRGDESPFTSMILIDDSDVVRIISNGTSINVNSAPVGTYSLRAIKYSGRLQIAVGDTIRDTLKTYSTDCSAWVTGSIRIVLSIPKAGKIVSVTGDSLLFACPGDRLPDLLSFNVTGQSNSHYSILIVNDKNKIIGITNPGSSFDFEGTPFGVDRAYGLSYSGILLATTDSLLTSKMSTDCFELTSNFIKIGKGTIKGGTISLKGGATSYYTCPVNDGTRNIFFDRKNSSESPYQYVLTTDAGSLVDFISSDTISFKGYVFQSFRIYGIAYAGKRIISKGTNIFVSPFSDGCFSVSENFIRVINEQPRGGGVRLPDGSNSELFCPSDPGKRIIQMRNVDVSSDPYVFVIVDTAFKIIDITPNFTYSFDSIPLGQYYIYGVSYVGNLVATKGSILNFTVFSDDCFSFSGNRIEVVIGQINGGVLTSSEGSTNVFTCPANLDADIIKMIPMDAKALGYRYVLTTDQNLIIAYSSSDQIDFGAATINTSCRVYGVAYKGVFNAVLNRDVFQTAFSTGCYDLSDNYVRVRKLVPPTQRIVSSLKDSVVTLCVGDSLRDTITVSSTDTLGFKTAFLGVENNIVTKVLETNKLQFEQDSAGILKLYSIIYTGRLLIRVGNFFRTDLPFSDDCFNLSANTILIDKVKQGPFCVITGTRDESWLSTIKLYPNPATPSQINLEWAQVPGSNLAKSTTIKISDLNGRIIKQLKISSQYQNHIQIPIFDLQNGLYILTLNSGQYLASRKFSVNK
ncbi:MAG: T9SS type A sorting domain-containing protein [Saprospiraceae bacterium]